MPRHRRLADPLATLPALVVVAALVAGCGAPTPLPSRSPAPSGGSAVPSIASGASVPTAVATSGGPSASSATSSPVAASAPAPTSPASSSPATGGSGSSPTPPASEQPAGVRLADVRLKLAPFMPTAETPVFLGHAGDGSGKLYQVDQAGRIFIVGPDGTVDPTPFIDLRARTKAGGEQGLLGLAFHPQFRENGRFFVDYTDLKGDQQISEFRVGADARGDPGSERKLIFLDDFAANHNGGMLAFGPDGDLYIAMGDGGGGGDPQKTGQDTNVLFGKILRITVDPEGDLPYGIPADNPFAESGGRPEIWDLGLRNPWRFSFDRETRDLWIGDVGQGEHEEVDLHAAGIPGGRNFGWSLMEGPSCFTTATCDPNGLARPVASYTHDDGCSITGGYVYRGSAWPMLEGIYLFADYCSGIVWGLDADAALDEPVEPRKLLESGQSVSSFGEDEVGELYLVSLNGSIFRITAP